MKSFLRFTLAVLIAAWVLAGVGSVQAQFEWETITTENAENLIEIAEVDLGEMFINDIAFSPDGSVLAIATNDGIQLFDVSGSGEMIDLMDEYFALYLTFSPDGSLIAFSGFHEGIHGLFVVDAQTGDEEFSIEVVLELQRDDELPFITELAFNTDGTLLAYVTNTLLYGQGLDGIEEGVIHVIDVEEEEEIFTIEDEDAVMGTLFFTPDGSMLVYSAMDMRNTAHRDGGAVHFCNLEDGEEVNVFDTGALATAFNPEGTLVATTQQVVIRMGIQTSWVWGALDVPVFDVESGDEYETFEYDSDVFVFFNDAAFNPDGSLLAAVSVGPLTDDSLIEGRLHLWDVEDASELVTVTLGRTDLATLAFSPAGTHIATLHSARDNRHDILQVWAVLPEGVCTVTANNTANLRGGPGTNYGIVGSLAAGEDAYVGGQTEGADGFIWYQLLSGAWIRSDLVTASETCESVPEVEAP